MSQSYIIDVLQRVGLAGTGPDVSRCASVSRVAGVSLTRATAPAHRAGSAPPAATGMVSTSSATDDAILDRYFYIWERYGEGEDSVVVSR